MKQKIIRFLKGLVCGHKSRNVEAVMTEEDGRRITVSTYTCDFCDKIVRTHTRIEILEPIIIKLKFKD